MNLLLATIQSPEQLSQFNLSEWDQLIRMAKQQKLLAHLGCLIARHGLTDECPKPALEAIQSSRTYVDYIHTQAAWEVSDLVRNLRNVDAPLALLKGQAYIAAGFPAAAGRFLSDVDVLLPKERLADVEKRLLSSGWVSQKIDDYDTRYYREWMHEIPPLMHRERNIELDIHHNLVPLTGRLQPDVKRLWEDIRPVEGSNLHVLSPADMLLHSATHLFTGEVAGGFRDLVDMHEMALHFGSDPAFWGSLPGRARELGLDRPLYYALYCIRRLLGSPIPEATFKEIAAPFYRSPSVILTRWLAQRVLTPALPGKKTPPVAAWLLYVRSHWIKMPPLLLASHLSRKAWRRVTAKSD